MAGNNNVSVVLQPSSWHISPVKQPSKPLVSKIRATAPFSDWSCPSLPSEKVMDKLCIHHLTSPLYKHLVLDSILLPLLHSNHRSSHSLSSCCSSAFASDSLLKLSPPTCSSSTEVEEPLTEASREHPNADLALEFEQSESGWTSYFDPSEDYSSSNNCVGGPEQLKHGDEQSEDSSVVSDASSGPERAIHNYSSYCHHQALRKRLFDGEATTPYCSTQAKLRRVEQRKAQSQALEDTATSSMQPCFNTREKPEDGQTEVM